MSHKEACRKLVTLYKAGDSVQSISDTLNKDGYTRSNGKPWTPQHVSMYANQQGFRRYGAYNKGATKTKRVGKAQPMKGMDIVDFAEDILTSNLSKEVKRTVLKQIIGRI